MLNIKRESNRYKAQVKKKFSKKRSETNKNILLKGTKRKSNKQQQQQQMQHTFTMKLFVIE